MRFGGNEIRHVDRLLAADKGRCEVGSDEPGPAEDNRGRHCPGPMVGTERARQLVVIAAESKTLKEFRR